MLLESILKATLKAADLAMAWYWVEGHFVMACNGHLQRIPAQSRDEIELAVVEFFATQGVAYKPWETDWEAIHFVADILQKTNAVMTFYKYDHDVQIVFEFDIHGKAYQYDNYMPLRMLIGDSEGIYAFKRACRAALSSHAAYTEGKVGWLT